MLFFSPRLYETIISEVFARFYTITLRFSGVLK